MSTVAPATKKMSRFQALKASIKSTNNTKLQSTSGGKAGGISFTGLIVEIRAPPPGKAGSLNFKVIATEGAGQVVPAVNKKNKLTGEYEQATYDDERTVPDVGQILSVSMYMQPLEVFEADVFQIVKVCGVVRNENWINAKKVLVIGDWLEAPSYCQDIPKPWEMAEKGIEYQPVPFELKPLDETAEDYDCGNVFVSAFNPAKPGKFISDEGLKILGGPFKSVTWSPDKETTVDVSMSFWNPKANLNQFGIVNDDAWVKLAPQLAPNVHAKGVMTVSNKDGKSTSLMGNTECNPQDYAVVAYTSRLDVDLLATLEASGVEVSAGFVKQLFDDEEVFQSEYAVDNPTARTTSTTICLNEFTGSKKILDRKDAKFICIADFADGVEKTEATASACSTKYVYVHLPEGPIAKKKRARASK